MYRNIYRTIYGNMYRNTNRSMQCDTVTIVAVAVAVAIAITIITPSMMKRGALLATASWLCMPESSKGNI